MIFLQSEDEYRAAIEEVETYLANEKPGTEQGERFVELLAAIDAYEEQNIPGDKDDLAAVLSFEIEGIKCDNPICDYVNENVKVDDFPQWVNEPCPKCGSTLLTPEDFDFVQRMQDFVGIMNNLSTKSGMITKNDDIAEIVLDVGGVPTIVYRDH